MTWLPPPIRRLSWYDGRTPYLTVSLNIRMIWLPQWPILDRIARFDSGFFHRYKTSNSVDCHTYSFGKHSKSCISMSSFLFRHKSEKCSFHFTPRLSLSSSVRYLKLKYQPLRYSYIILRFQRGSYILWYFTLNKIYKFNMHLCS